VVGTDEEGDEDASEDAGVASSQSDELSSRKPAFEEEAGWSK
jgi:hypothetical protein